MRRYIILETAISVAINAAISVAFVFLAFGGEAHIALPRLVRDAVPQSFMIALMSTIVPTLLTRRRVAAGAIAAIVLPRALWPRSLATRAICVAVVASLLGASLCALLLWLYAPAGLNFAGTLLFKAAFGAMLAAIVTPMMLRQALAEIR
ncbi:hypothetical protein NED98_00045 [Sphingomonas sp. MMSM20]|uniref:hypothetical protein n=1 Tax=Sphingomonas lycopersici TaxID=2951807 RepID=UPI0022372A42|nr:hypothetical protein [Sphingomonas lycopersici]MCW6528619.1 hypothetical protein [Sphingomonas lycopersici]